MLLGDIEETIRNRRAQVAYVHGDRRTTFADLDAMATSVAGELRRCGFQPADRVGLRLEASVEYPAACVGIWRAGGVVVPLDATLSDSELAYFLDVARVRFLVTPADGKPGVAVSRINAFPPQVDGTTSDDADLLVLFSSGTTGPPKGLVHSREGLSSLARRHVTYSGVTGDDVVLATSLFHTGFGFHSYIDEPLLAGATVVIAHPFLPRAALEVAGQEGVTWIQTVPAVLKLLAAVEVDARRLLPDLRAVRLSAATLDPTSRDAFYERFGIQPLQGYGMNELGRIASATAAHRPTSSREVGRPEVDVRIFDDDGETRDPGELGEIGVRAPSLCRPSYLLEGGCREPLPIRDGYFLTGDFGRLSDDGILELAGRRKSFILTPRYKVNPHDVEQVLVEHPNVVEAAVLPEPGHAGFEAIKAVVATSKPISKSELVSFCRRRLPAGKCPQTVVFTDRLPRNALGKVEIRMLKLSAPAVPDDTSSAKPRRGR